MIQQNPISKIFNLKNKVVVLTGSSGRLGSEYAHILSQAGANIVLIDINSKLNKRLEKLIQKKYHTKTLALTVDISKSEEINKMVKNILKIYGHIDILINNAFYNPNQSKSSAAGFEKFPIELWNDVLKVNLTGVFLCCQSIGKVMIKQNNGVIINISSIYGMIGADQRIYGSSGLNSPVSYAASKGAIINLTRYLAAYWRGKNIRVNSLSLGGVEDKKYMSKEFIKNVNMPNNTGTKINNDTNNTLNLLVKGTDDKLVSVDDLASQSNADFNTSLVNENYIPPLSTTQKTADETLPKVVFAKVSTSNKSMSELAFERTDSTRKGSALNNPYAQQLANLAGAPYSISAQLEMPLSIRSNNIERILSSSVEPITDSMPVRLPAKLLTSVYPKYPNTAKRKRIETDIEVTFTIDTNGYIRDIQYNGNGRVNYFRNTIRSSLKKWRFTPASFNNKPVESTMSKIFSFSIAK